MCFDLLITTLQLLLFLSYFTFILNIMLIWSAITLKFVYSELLLLGEVNMWSLGNLKLTLSRRSSCKITTHRLLRLSSRANEVNGYCTYYIYLRQLLDDRIEMINVHVNSALLHFTGLLYHTGTVRESISIHFAQQKIRSTIISMKLIKTKNLNKYKTKIY